MSGRWSQVLLPPPTAVTAYLVSAVKDGSLLDASIVTMERLLIGYAIGVAIGLLFGLLTSTSRFFHDTIGLLALASAPVISGIVLLALGHDRRLEQIPPKSVAAE